MNTLTKRLRKPTPVFFKKLRNIGLGIVAISGAILTAPVALPVVVLKVASYLAVAGGVMGGVSQTTVKNERN